MLEKAESRSAWVRPSRLFPLGKTYLKLVVPLRLRLVVGPHRPRVEGLDGDSAAGHRLLGLPVVVELGPVIGEAGLHWERLAGARLRDGPHRLEDGLPGRFRPAFVYEQSDLEVGLRPGDGEDRLRVLGFADDGVELAGGGLLVGGDVVEVVLMHPPKKLPHVGDDEAPGFFAPGEAPPEPDVTPELVGPRREQPAALYILFHRCEVGFVTLGIFFLKLFAMILLRIIDFLVFWVYNKKELSAGSIVQ